MQAFEPRLTADLFARWPDRVSRVLGYDEDRAWLLLADAGTADGLLATFDLAMRVGAFAHAIAWMRQRDHLPSEAQPDFDVGFAGVLRRALACVTG